MRRIPNHKDSFESRLKEQVEGFSMTPGADSWNAMQHSLLIRNSRIGFLTHFFLFVFLVPFSIRIAAPGRFAGSNFAQDKTITPSPKTIRSIEPLHFAHRIHTPLTSPGLTSSERQVNKEGVLFEKESSIRRQTESISSFTSITAHTEPASTKRNYLNVLNARSNPRLVQTNSLLSSNNSKELLSAHYKPKAKAKPPKNLQLFVVPSISHRVPFRMSNGALTNTVSNKIKHLPSAGFEVGAAILIPVTNRLAFRSGLQFNFTHFNTRTISVAATSGSGSTNENSGPFSPAVTIHNQSYQVSVPVGIEYRIQQGSRLSWHVAAQMQATYMMKTTGDLYVRSVQKPAIARDILSRLNSHAAVETFVRWNLKQTVLQIGPQIRCQLRSNTHAKISNKEYLIDYGIKIGIVQTLH